MQNLFVEENEIIEIKFTVATNDSVGAIFCGSDREKLISDLKDIKAKLEDYEIEDYIANFKKPNFGMATALYDSVFKVEGQGVSFNPITARYRKIILLIKDWNLTGEFKKPTEDEIKKLNPMIASEIGIKLDVEIGDILG